MMLIAIKMGKKTGRAPAVDLPPIGYS